MEYNSFQKQFLQSIADIQEEKTQIALSKYKEGDDIENVLFDVTFEVIAGVMTMMDGYYKGNNKMDIINIETSDNLKENPFIELHDSICDYIKYEKPGS